MNPNNNEIEKRLWDAADSLRANSKLKSSEYSLPVLGLIFLRYADFKFAQAEETLHRDVSTRRRGIGKYDYQARGAMFLPPEARYARLLNLPEGADVAREISNTMKAIEKENEALAGVLPKDFRQLDKSILIELVRDFNDIPLAQGGDVFGKIYEYFLGKFAMNEGRKGGEFFTPTSVVKLIVQVIEPFHGRIYDPACGSGGMFVQSAQFIENHKSKPVDEIAVYGQEKTAETVRLCKMNLAVHGLGGEIREANSYYDDIHKSVGKFDFVMANPPFNVDKVDKDRLAKDKARFPYGMPKIDNANYLWIQLFYSALNNKGRAGFVMANSASDARGSELEIRKQMIQAGAVDVMIAVGSNFFYTVTLPCTLWFLDNGKNKTPRKDRMLFIDARNTYHQIDRAHREFTEAQIEFLGNIVRLYRGEEAETDNGSADLMKAKFPKGKYVDVAGLCKVATLKEIEAQGWSLNPGRYVGVTEKATDDFVFKERLEELNEELEMLNVEASELESRISSNTGKLLA
ncbi:MAG: SAM-dependent DNA methyltransferase [Chloroflexi bacterium]|nr:SAM-dependent DNA methyltransferase [Chloroflexota bacterium]